MNPSPEQKENAEMKPLPELGDIYWEGKKMGDMSKEDLIAIIFDLCCENEASRANSAPVVAESAIQEAGKAPNHEWKECVESIEAKLMDAEERADLNFCSADKWHKECLQAQAENAVKDEALKKSLAELNDAILDTQGLVAEGILSGNIVKENFYKGHLSALNFAQALMEETATPATTSRAMIEEMERLRKTQENLWLVWSHEHGAWWGANNCGYYTCIESAGRYSLGQALQCASSRSKTGEAPPEVIVPSPELIAALNPQKEGDES